MDALVPGFGVHVTDSGSRTFILRPRFPGSDTPSRREIDKVTASAMYVDDATYKMYPEAIHVSGILHLPTV